MMTEKMTGNYETIFIIDATLTEEEVTAAYEIDDKTEGYYVLVDFTAAVDFPKELDRQYRINDSILRTIIIRKDEE